jgi:exosortase
MPPPSPPSKDGNPTVALLTVAGVGICLGWAYWPTLGALENRWATDPQLSHGFIVPLYASIVLWMRRAWFPAGPWQLNPWGFGVIAVTAIARLGGAYFHVDWFDGLTLLLSLSGLCLLAGGWKFVGWVWPGLVLLLFVLPLPYQVEIALAGPLQRIATVAAAYTLQTLGYPAVPEGNVIVIDDLRLGVVEACNGLGMLASFFALSAAVAFVIQRPWYEKGIVFVSAIPIALIANLVRITATGWAHKTFSPQVADALFHSYGGWFVMPPLALAMLGLELLILRRLIIVKPAVRPVPVTVLPTAPQPAPATAERTSLRGQPLPPAAPVVQSPGPRGR